MANEPKPLDILVIDDRADIRLALEALIEIADARPTSASGVREGIELYDQRKKAGTPFYGVLTDLNTGEEGLSGLDVVRHVKTQDPNIPVYVVTAAERTPQYSSLASGLTALNPDGIIPKPWGDGQIESIIEQIRIQAYGNKHNQS